MSQVNDKNLKFRFTGFHMALCMAAFFGVIISVNLFMATLASSTWTGLVVKNSYIASQHFNAKLLDAEAQNKRGWRSSIVYQDSKFQIQIYEKNGTLLSLSNAELFVGRPAFEQKDQTLKLYRQTDGIYNANVTLDFGGWDIRVTGQVGEHSYRREERIFVDKNGNGRIERLVTK